MLDVMLLEWYVWTCGYVTAAAEAEGTGDELERWGGGEHQMELFGHLTLSVCMYVEQLEKSLEQSQFLFYSSIRFLRFSRNGAFLPSMYITGYVERTGLFIKWKGYIL